MKAKITKTSIDAFEAGDKDRFLWDTELAGFGLKVTPKGKKTLLFQYRLKGRNKSTKRITIGAFGKPLKHLNEDYILTADRARKIAKVHSGAVSGGIDPRKAVNDSHEEMTISEVGALFLTKYVPKLKPSTQEEYSRVFAKRLPKKFSNLGINEVTKGDIEALMVKMKDNPYGANRSVRVLSKMFNWALDSNLKTSHFNPCDRVKKYPERKVKRYLSGDEYARLGKVLGNAEEKSLANLYQITAIRLLCLTGARLKEILTLKWEYIKLHEKRIYLPDSKGGQVEKNLNDDAVELLQRLPQIENNPYVICGAKEGSHLVNLQKAWRRIRKEAELEDVRIHDLRHSFASVSINQGQSLAVIGNLLGHKNPSTTARYAHLADKVSINANQGVGKAVSKSMGHQL